MERNLHETANQSMKYIVWVLTCHILQHLGSSANSNLLSALQPVGIYVRYIKHLCGTVGHVVDRICGFIDSRHDFQKFTWKILPVKMDTLVLSFNQFDLMYSKQCSINYLEVVRYIRYTYRQLYCGNLLPWTETCECLQMSINLRLAWKNSFSTTLMISYQTHRHKTVAYERTVISQFYQRFVYLTEILWICTTRDFLIKVRTQSHYFKLLFHVYDGPNDQCDKLQASVSGTHQLYIRSVMNTSRVVGLTILFHKVKAPQLLLGYQYTYSVSDKSYLFCVIQLSQTKLSKLTVQIIVKHETGIAGAACDYGGLYMEYENSFITRSRFDDPCSDFETITILRCINMNIPPYIEVTLTKGHFTIFAYKPFYNISVQLTAISTTTSHFIIPFHLPRSEMPLYLDVADFGHSFVMVIPTCFPEISKKEIIVQLAAKDVTVTKKVTRAQADICQANYSTKSENLNTTVHITTHCCWLEPLLYLELHQLNLTHVFLGQIIRARHFAYLMDAYLHIQLSFGFYLHIWHVISLSYIFFHVDGIHLTQIQVGHLPHKGADNAFPIYEGSNYSFAFKARFNSEIIRIATKTHNTIRINLSYFPYSYMPFARDWYEMVGSQVNLWKITYDMTPQSLLPSPLCTSLQCYSYKHEDNPMSWNDAKHHCEMKHQMLLAINSYEEYELILDLMRSRLNRQFALGSIIFLGLSYKEVVCPFFPMYLAMRKKSINLHISLQ